MRANVRSLQHLREENLLGKSFKISVKHYFQGFIFIKNILYIDCRQSINPLGSLTTYFISFHCLRIPLDVIITSELTDNYITSDNLPLYQYFLIYNKTLYN